MIASLLRFLGRKTKCHFVIEKKVSKNLLPSLIHQSSTQLIKYLSHFLLFPGILPPNHSMADPFKSQLSHHLLITEKLFCLPYLNVLPPIIIMHSITCFIFSWNYLINGLLPPTKCQLHKSRNCLTCRYYGSKVQNGAWHIEFSQ